MVVRLASLDGPMIDAVERGLRRALDEAPAGPERTRIVNDLVTLLEARGRWRDAAATLAAEAGAGVDGAPNLARAAQNYLKAQDPDAAEQSLLTAVLRMPEDAGLYRDLAVDVYAARGDFPMAESVLKAGERNAVDMLPVYDAVTEVLAKRESTRIGDREMRPLLPLTLDQMVP